MRSLKKKVKSVLKRHQPDQQPTPNSAQASDNDPTQQATPVTTQGKAEVASETKGKLKREQRDDNHDVERLSTSQTLFNKAYEKIQSDDDKAEIATAYTKLLVQLLTDDPKDVAPDTSNEPEGSTGAVAGGLRDTRPDDAIEAQMEDPLLRQRLMKRMVEVGRAKFKENYKTSMKLGEFAERILAFKPLGDLAVSNPHAAPAALPWAGVCVGLQMLCRPGTTAKSNLSGISYVLSRMEWYDALAEYVIDPTDLESADPTCKEVSLQLEKTMVKLYESILLFQMKSVCSYHRHMFPNILRDIAGCDDWSSDLQSVKSLETTFQTDSKHFNQIQSVRNLEKIREIEERGQKTAESMNQSISRFIDIQKQQHRDEEDKKCLKDLFLVDPYLDMQKIERKKDPLDIKVSEWVLKTDEYTKFTDWMPGKEQYQLMWIKGDAGTGKTMLTMGIIRHLLGQFAALSPSVCYFFCQGTNQTLNSATAALRCLMWQLLIQQPKLIRHLRTMHENSGATLFEGEHAFLALEAALNKMLEDPVLSPVYFIVDALDECETGRRDLITVLTTSLSKTFKVKLLVSGRPSVKHGAIDKVDSLVELDAQKLEKPVHDYIESKLSSLKEREGYQQAILEQIRLKVLERANNTFLWVSFAFKELDKCGPDDEFPHGDYALELIKALPSGLSRLYDLMMDKVYRGLEDDSRHCKNILVSTVLAYRPLSLVELAQVAGLPTTMTPESIVAKCGSFLTISDGIVSLYHQSVKEYLSENLTSRLELNGACQGHLRISEQCIAAMTKTLHYNMYNIDYGPWNRHDSELDSDSFDSMYEGASNSLGSAKELDSDPLASVRYACEFWAEHLVQSTEDDSQDQSLAYNAPAHEFLKGNFLYWVEALSLLDKLSQGSRSILNLLRLAEKRGTSPQLATFLKDARYFMMGNATLIYTAPLQTYGSALAFTPMQNDIRMSQWEKRLSCIESMMCSEEHQETDRQPLWGHSDWVNGIAFSPDGKTLASASSDGTVRLWDPITGVSRTSLLHDYWVHCVAFSPDGQTLASGSGKFTIRLWDVGESSYRTLEGHSRVIEDITFSPDGKQLASASWDHTIRLWDLAANTCEVLQNDGDKEFQAIAFSPDGRILASDWQEKSIRLWDLADLRTRSPKTLEGHAKQVGALAFSPDGKFLASGSDDCTFRLWEIYTGSYRSLERPGYWVEAVAVAFTRDGNTLASGCSDGTIMLWNMTAIDTGPCQVLTGHSGPCTSLTFAPDGKMLASASMDSSICLWDIASVKERPAKEMEISPSPISESAAACTMAFAPNGRTLASGSYGGNICLWNKIAVGEVFPKPMSWESHKDWIRAMCFHPDGQTLASTSGAGGEIRLWDLTTATEGSAPSFHVLKGYNSYITVMAFAPDGKKLASGSRGKICIWDLIAPFPATNTGLLPHVNIKFPNSVWLAAFAFVPSGDLLAAAVRKLEGGYTSKIQLWNVVGPAICVREFDVSGWINTISVSDDGNWLRTDANAIAVDDGRLQPLTTTVYAVTDQWITCNGARTIYIPQHYEFSTVSGTDIALGSSAGNVAWIRCRRTIDFRLCREQLTSMLPEAICDSLEISEVDYHRPVWTCWPSEDITLSDIPLRINEVPVVIPVQSRYPASAFTAPPSDPYHGSIDSSRIIDEETIGRIFREFKDILGFYLLINGMLQLIVSDDYDVEHALSHRPNTFGKLRVSYIHDTICPTAETQTDTTSTISTGEPMSSIRDTTSTQTVASSQPSVQAPTSLRAGATVEARVAGYKGKLRFQAKIGLVTEADGQFHLVVPSHMLTMALAEAKSKSFPGEDWAKSVYVVGNDKRQVGRIVKTFDPDAQQFPRGFQHDVSLVAISEAPQNTSDTCTEWMSQKDWNDLKLNSKKLFLMGLDTQAKSIGLDDTDFQAVGQGIRLNVDKEPSKRRRLVSSLFKGKGSQGVQQNETGISLVSRSILYRIDSSKEVGALSGTAVCTGDVVDGRLHTKVAGFSSWEQPCSELPPSFDAKEEHISIRLKNGRLAFHGAFRAPQELRENHKIVCSDAKHNHLNPETTCAIARST